MGNIKRKEIFILMLCIVIGFALRFYTFDKKSLWIDEVYTFNEARYDLKEQFLHYKENPTYLQPPLFYLLTHLFYPFTKPERDLRIIPLIFGTLSLPMIYLLARSFSPAIALPCTICLTFMTYHISLSQDGRSYSLLLFLGMTGFYFLIKHLKTSKKRYLIPVAISFALSFYTNFTFIPFIALFQIFLFYQVGEKAKRPNFSSFLILNGLILLLCLPWVLLSVLSYRGQPVVETLRGDGTLGSFSDILYNVIQDWAPHMPVAILSIVLMILLPFFSKIKKNALILLTVLILPIGGIYIFCGLFNITHFVSSRYFINLLPLFFITLFLSLHDIEVKFERLRRSLRLKLLFIILFIASNLVILPFYYRAEKQDFRGLVTYLKNQLQEGDKIFIRSIAYLPGMLHYFGMTPQERQYTTPYKLKDSGKKIEIIRTFAYENKIYIIYSSSSCCAQYVGDGNRLWIVVHGKETVKEIIQDSPCVLKGYFDGSFASFSKFPSEASMYLFLWDPQFPGEKGIDLPIE